MEIIRILPQGFCGGVRNALNIIYDLPKDPTIPKPIYIFGSLVHNQHVMRSLEKDFIILEEPDNPFELIDSLSLGTIVFTAHGTDQKIIDYAKAKNFYCLDTICSRVKEIHETINDKIKTGKKIIYLGKKTHKETKAVLALSEDIYLIEKIEDLDNINLSANELYATNQTTLEYEFTANFYLRLKELYPRCEVGDKICSAAKNRQLALDNYPDLDLVYVAGDSTSSNTLSLLQRAKKLFPKALLIDSAKRINKDDLKPHYKIGVTSGASVPDYIIEEIISTLKSY